MHKQPYQSSPQTHLLITALWREEYGAKQHPVVDQGNSHLKVAEDGTYKAQSCDAGWFYVIEFIADICVCL